MRTCARFFFKKKFFLENVDFEQTCGTLPNQPLNPLNPISPGGAICPPPPGKDPAGTKNFGTFSFI